MSEHRMQSSLIRAGVVVLAVLAAAPAPAEPQLSLSSAGAVLGGDATMKLRLDNAGDLCSGVNGKIALPPGVGLADVALGGLLSEEFTVVHHAPEDNPENIYTFVAYSTTGRFAADSGALLLLTLQISDVPAELGLDAAPLIEATVPLLSSGLAAGDGQTSLAHSTASGRLLLMREAAPVLDVSPLTHRIGAEGGNITVAVANVGFMDMPWTAAPVEASGWITIASGAAGTNEGVVTAHCEANPAGTSRTAQILVDAGDVPGSPVIVTVTQLGDETPCLSVTPMALDVPATSGLCSVQAANTGNGTMAWSARVVAGFEWLSVTLGESGTDGGAITLAHHPNTTSAARAGLLEITAPGALDSPAVVTITQRTSTGPLLVVSPPERTVPASAGAAEFNVRNAGGGAMTWTATVTEGAGWLAIESGTAGLQEGIIRVAVARNMMLADRVGTIRVEAQGAGESPAQVRVVQRARQLLAITAPNGGEYFRRGDSVAIAWTSESETTEAVSLMLIRGGGLHSTIAVTADNSGAHQWTVPRNLEPGDDYQIQIMDVANAAIHDESDDTFAVACPPDAPQHVTASDDRSDMVVVTWDAVDSAESYLVFRSAAGSAEEPVLLGSTQTTRFEDTNALAPEKAWIGCRPGMKIHHYLYSVCAVNVCAQSDPSEPDDGCRIEETEKTIYAPVLPSGPVVEGAIMVRPDATLAVRLRGTPRIDAASIEGRVEWGSGSSLEVQWLPLNEWDGWVLYRPEHAWQPGEHITMTVHARAVSGEPLGPIEYRFEAMDGAEPAAVLWQPDYTDFDASTIDLTKEANDSVALLIAQSVDGAETESPAFIIAPLAPFDMAQRVWLPLPEPVTAETVRIEYYHVDGPNSGWYPANVIEGWMAAGSELELELDGTHYLGITVRHGGIVRLAPTNNIAPTYEAAAFPHSSRAVDVALFAVLVLVLALARTVKARHAQNQ
jgi:hypothetical protein